MSALAPPVLRFDKLPAELISLIIYHAQITWHNEHFAVQAPYAEEVNRYEPPPPGSAPSHVLACCNGARSDFSRPTCICSDSGRALPNHLPSPAHSASLVSKKLRGVLEGNSHIWQLDNTVYPAIARRSGERRTTSRGQTVIEYGSRSLVALDVCACLLRGLRLFYSSLESVKLRLPWSGDRSLGSELRQFLRDIRGGENSPLRSFDMEALDADPFHVRDGVRRRMTALESVNLRRSWFYRGNVYYYSNTLISLCLRQGPGTSMVFGSALSIGLSACADALEYLTIDIPEGFVADIEDSITFLRLRYFRLCTDPLFGAVLLGRLVLPYALDFHLEQVESWKECFTAKHQGTYQVPFWPSESPDPLDWRRPPAFAQDLAEPHRTRLIHSSNPAEHQENVADQAEPLWRRSTAVIGLDVHIDPNTEPFEPAAARFPASVSVALAESVDELRPVLRDPVGRDAGGSRELGDKLAARRSLTFRDNEVPSRPRCLTRPRDIEVNTQYPKALYDTLQYVLSLVPDAKASASERRVREFVFAKDSWLPDRSLGYQHILGRFTALTVLHFDGPLLSGRVQFKQNMEGCLAFEHLHALAYALNAPGTGGVYLCPALEVIHLKAPVERLLSLQERVDWIETINSPDRLAFGAQRIRFT
ncbi:unnamed protein product [Peniophora sp. CBMAI 1063]|nr:unnamed protein product [Peniophora sp. CBMAI 1063]